MQSCAPSIGVRFERDETHDLYVCYPCGHLRTKDDCDVWWRAFREFFETLGYRVDIVVVLDMVSVEPEIAELYQRRRLRMVEQYVRYSARVAATAQLAKIIARKEELSPSLTTIYDDISTAVESIEHLRASAETTELTRG